MNINNKIIIFIGEGKSEYSFFESIIGSRYGFLEENQKSSILYRKGNIYVFLGHPSIGVKHKGGDSMLMKKITYTDIKSKIQNQAHFIDNLNGAEFTYIILTDGDKRNFEKKISRAQEYINNYINNYQGNIYNFIPIKEIETWFLYGLGSNFTDQHPIDNREYLKYTSADPSELNNTKEILDKILPDYISGNRSEIGRAFGKHIDIKKAKSNCGSFCKFIDFLDNILLTESGS